MADRDDAAALLGEHLDRAVSFIQSEVNIPTKTDITTGVMNIDWYGNPDWLQVEGGGRVFVHCVAGVSRSSTVCIAYAMRHFDLGGKPYHFFVAGSGAHFLEF